MILYHGRRDEKNYRIFHSHSMIVSRVGEFQFTDVVVQPIIMVATYHVVLTTIKMAK